MSLGLVTKGQQAPLQNLLDAAEQNLGNSAVIQPAQTVAPGNPVKLLDLRADSPRSRVVTVALSQSLPNPNALTVDIACPIYGVIEFGNGGSYATVELDIPG